MKIGIDGRMIGDRMHGIARHTLNLLKSILNIDKKNHYVLLITDKFPYRQDMTFDNLRYIYMKSPFVSLSEPLELYTVLRKEKFDLFHSPSFIPPFYSGKPFFMTIHDLSHLTYSGLTRRLYYKFIITPYVKKAKRIITVSEFSKLEICKNFELDEEKVSVVYNGVEDRFKPINNEEDIKKIRECYNLPERFIFTIGNEKIHKNLKILLRAVKYLDKVYPLVVNLDPKGDIEKEARKLGVRERVHFIGYIEDRDLPLLYNAATVFVCISLNEGFGLPVLEAMASGCPSVVSKSASMPEVCGNSAYYVDPYNENDISEGINKAIHNFELRNKLIKKGLERAGLFRWEREARKMIDLYGEIGGNS